MGLDNWLDLNNDGDVSGGEAFFGLSTAGALGFAVGADEAQYAAHEKREAERKDHRRAYLDLEDERDELREEVERLKKRNRDLYLYGDDDDDDFDDEDEDEDDDDDEPLFDYEEFYRDYKEHGLPKPQKTCFYDPPQDAESPEEELAQQHQKVVDYERLLNEQSELIDKLKAEIAALKEGGAYSGAPADALATAATGSALCGASASSAPEQHGMHCPQCDEHYQSQALPLVKVFKRCIDDYQNASGPFADGERQMALDEAARIKKKMDQLNAIFGDRVPNTYDLQIKR